MSKYHAVKVPDDGYTFDSKAEHRRYCELKLLQQAGEIDNLVVHQCFELKVGAVVVAVYVADFSYRDISTTISSSFVIEDVKGVRTAVYKLKKKLMKAIYGIEIQEVEA